MPSVWKSVTEALSPIFKPAGNTIAGITPGDYASPQQPIRPVLPPSVGVRAWDFQPGINLQFTPRGDQPINFAQLFNMSRSFDLCRLMIETRKDQIVNRPWVVRVKQLPGETKKDKLAREAKNTNVTKLTKFLQRPDQVHAFPLWIRMWLEQLLVFDAPCIYPVMNMLGEPLGLRLISGTTITPLVDKDGFIPQPPDPAYQQIVLGLPASNLMAGKSAVKEYSANQLIYSPRNPRVDSRYGYSPVEQIIVTLQIASHRQQFLKNYYTEGNVPEGFVFAPKEWTPSQIKEMQNWLDSKLAGNLKQKRRMIFAPGGGAGDGKGVIFSKEKALTDMTDEYLIRVVAFAFSITPQNLIKQVNRGTAKESSDVAQIEGLEPFLKHIEQVMNLDIIQGVFGIDDCEFAYQEEREMDPLKQAQVDQIYINTGTYSRDEVREARGDDPLGIPQGAMYGITTGTGFVPLDTPVQPQGEGVDEDPEDDPDDPDEPPTQNKVKKKALICDSRGMI